MSESQEFRLPDVGEGLTEAEIVSWQVAVGDTIAINDSVVEIETAKSVVELPSPFAGVVEQLLVNEGATVPVGTPLIVIGSGANLGQLLWAGPEAGASLEQDDVSARVTGQAAGSVASLPPDGEDKPQVLVGPGPKEAAARQRRLGVHRPVGAGSSEDDVDGPESVPEAFIAADATSNRARTTPPVRLRAKALGVDLETLTSPTALITADDVDRAAGQSVPPTVSDSAMDGVDRVGERRVAVKGVRKVTAEAMVRSAFTAPHVTEWVTIDVTRSMDLVRRLKNDPAWREVRVSPLLLVARAFVLAVGSYPDVNASWDDGSNEIVYKDYVNLGIAAATPRGLLVPNIKHAHAMDLRTLADSLSHLIETASAGKTQPTDMSGGTVTITNIGALGVDAGTPILNPGESAILAFGAVRQQPWVVNGKVEVREVTQLALSFDHRLVDGELGSNVLVRTGEILTDPANALLYV